MTHDMPHREPPVMLPVHSDKFEASPMHRFWGDEHFDDESRADTRIGPAGLLVIAIIVVACIAYWSITGA
jgi:hypothetical protein